MRAPKLLLGAAVGALLAIFAPVANASPISGVITVKSQFGVVGVNATDTEYATCPEGTQMVGGGGFVQNGPENSLALVASLPVSTNTWSVTGRNWSRSQGGVVAEAQCALPEPGGGLASTFIVTGDTHGVGGNNATDTESATCPLGSEMLSGGGEWGDGHQNGVAFVEDFPGPVRTWYVTGRSWSGSANTLHATVLCGTPGLSGGLVRASFFTTILLFGNTVETETATCSSGLVIAGGADWSNHQLSGLAILGLSPSGGTGYSARGINGSGSGAKLTTGAICSR